MIRMSFKSVLQTGPIALIRAAGAFVDRLEMRKIGDSVALRIKNRTRRGLDQHRKRFTRYSAAYAAQKGVARTAVDLKRTGVMQRGFGVRKATSRSVQLGPGSAPARAVRHQAGIGVPKREWMGFSAEDRRFMKDQLRDIVRRRKKRRRPR